MKNFSNPFLKQENSHVRFNPPLNPAPIPLALHSPPYDSIPPFPSPLPTPFEHN